MVEAMNTCMCVWNGESVFKSKIPNHGILSYICGGRMNAFVFCCILSANKKQNIYVIISICSQCWSLLHRLDSE